MASYSAVSLNISSDDNVERSLKRFKRMCESCGIVKEYRKRKEYKKPSIKAREKSESAVKRRSKTQFKSSRQSSRI